MVWNQPCSSRPAGAPGEGRVWVCAVPLPSGAGAGRPPPKGRPGWNVVQACPAGLLGEGKLQPSAARKPGLWDAALHRADIHVQVPLWLAPPHTGFARWGRSRGCL